MQIVGFKATRGQLEEDFTRVCASACKLTQAVFSAED